MLFLILVIYHCFALNCVDLKKVGTLTFRQNQYTVGGRTSSVPQLTCVENCASVPKQVNCYNIGNAYDKDPTWKCYSHGKNVVFSKVQVICESCRHKYDSDVLEGSCSLEYGIYSISDINHQGGEVVSLIFAVFFIFLIMMILSHKDDHIIPAPFPNIKVCTKEVKSGVVVTNRPVKSVTRREEDLVNIFSGVTSNNLKPHRNNVSFTFDNEDIFNGVNPISTTQRREEVGSVSNDLTQRREDNNVSSVQRREEVGSELNNVSSVQRREDNNVSSVQRREDNNVSSVQRREEVGSDLNNVSSTQRRENSINWLKELYG